MISEDGFTITNPIENTDFFKNWKRHAFRISGQSG
jgi:hypothetical protein